MKSKRLYFKEFFYVFNKEEDTEYAEPSSRKFWATFSQLLFFITLFLKLIVVPVLIYIGTSTVNKDNRKIEVKEHTAIVGVYLNEKVLTNFLIGTLAAQAVTAMGWYSARNYLENNKKKFPMNTPGNDNAMNKSSQRDSSGVTPNSQPINSSLNDNLPSVK